MNVAEIFEQEYQNPWDWALFFTDPLEIEPGAPMTIDGWVQTNSSLWTPLNSLTFGDKVTYGTSWNITAMPGDTHLISDGDTYASPNFPSNLPPSQGTPGEPFGLDPSDVFTTSNPNDNSDGYHELIEVPDPHYPDPVSTDRYFDQAGVKVIMTENGNTTTTTIYDNSQPASVSGGSAGSNGVITGGVTVLGNSIGTGNSPAQTNLFNSVAGALVFGQSIQDNRQNATVAITELNVGTLNSSLSSNGVSFNNVVYITDEGASASNQRAIELVNGATLPSGGLTVASQNPVYIQGDYNTGVGPPSNTNSSSSSLASNYNWAPASVAADAVDILSNAWNNATSTATMGLRVATNTTINAAIMSGNVPTNGSNYSGGAENFPRFLEDWSAATFVYYGSMVELYASQQATGIWGQGNVYNPPTRVWHYDSNFQLKPPPGSIMVVDYIKGQWYQY
jgi:hypothetical protein